MPKLHLPGKPKPYLMAHRGNRVLFPENTLSAFRQAVEDGADIIETDLQVTMDGAFLCLHDATLERTTNGTGVISEQTFDQVRSYNAAASRPDLPFEPIPTIPEIARAIPEQVMIAFELKSDAFTDVDTCKRLVAQLQHESLTGRAVILSFSLQRLNTLRTVDTGLPLGWITSNQPWPQNKLDLFGPFWPLLLLNPMLCLIAHRMDQLVCPLDPLPDRRLGLYRVLGCDAVLSDNPGQTALALGRKVV